jgi:hypothetical protein
MPALTITEKRGRISLYLGGLARGEGASLQEAADELVAAERTIAVAFRTSGWTTSPEAGPDFETINFLHELGEIAAAGGDIRDRVFA